MIDNATLWTVILSVGIGSYALRFTFLGIIGDRALPEWVVRHLRYTAVAMLPALVSPLVLMPEATDGQLDPPRLIAAMTTIAVGFYTKNAIFAVFGGAVTLYGMMYLLG